MPSILWPHRVWPISGSVAKALKYRRKHGRRRAAFDPAPAVTLNPEPMWLTVTSGPDRGTTVEVASERFVIGRDDDCDLVLDDEKVSRHHAELRPGPDGVVVRDLDSANGTFVNGKRISEPRTLQGDERLRVGETVLGCSATKPAPLAEGAPGPSRSTIQRLVQDAVETESRSVLLLVAGLVAALL